ncbi:hypothetical protein INT44_004378 [Umbelopsis vinacea]|uniref:Signal recognition particle subunit SRP14 n=1 Tax=Umbelopsis vinacea TaxID=44442 RepID=A0A8H7QBA8_9FUNG|nr:hypothetical protein INT44_004378 [Umbelopsis vinacea]KAI9284243.1 signal recognition particle, SRP9/SRP14 subunit [Umbelopsis sp. AD052]
MKELDPIPFTVELGQFYQRAKTSGTVNVTMKRLTREPSQGQRKRKLEDTTMAEATETTADDDKEYVCLIRATFKNENISTRVNGSEYEKFQQAYSNIIKAYMDALKKKDRKAKVNQKKPTAAAAASKLKPSA